MIIRLQDERRRTKGLEKTLHVRRYRVGKLFVIIWMLKIRDQYAQSREREEATTIQPGLPVSKLPLTSDRLL